MTEGGKGFFTKDELQAIKAAMSGISNVGFRVESYTSSDPQMKAFFDKAKLWRVVKNIISVLYIKRLSEGKMFLKDEDGNEYKVTIRKEKEKV